MLTLKLVLLFWHFVLSLIKKSICSWIQRSHLSLRHLVHMSCRAVFMPDVTYFSWESSLRCLRFFLLDLTDERPGLCREGGWRWGRWRVEGMPVPWSVFPQALCNLVLKLEPCGNQQVPVHYMRRAAKMNWGNQLRKAQFAKRMQTSLRQQTC